MDCPKCGDEMFVIEGLHFDRDGIRNARFCDECKIVFAVTASSVFPTYIMKDYDDLTHKERIISALKNAIHELEGSQP